MHGHVNVKCFDTSVSASVVPKFHSKNKFEKLVHLVGFIIGIYDDARSRERQMFRYICISLSSSEVSFQKLNSRN